MHKVLGMPNKVNGVVRVGLIGSGGPLGQLMLAPATQAMISLAGWVSAALALAALALASLPLALAFRQPAAPARTAAAAPDSLRKALNSPHYWIINATFFVCGLHVFFLMTHLPGVIELCGLPSSVSGMSLAALGLFSIAGSIAAGFVIQRCSMKRTLASLYAARGIGITLFMAAPKNELTVLAFSAWMGLTTAAADRGAHGFMAQRLATLLGITFLVHQRRSSAPGSAAPARAHGKLDLMWRSTSCRGVAATVSLPCAKSRPALTRLSARLTNRAHLSRSALMKSRNCAGLLPTGSEPSSTMRLRMSGASSALTSSACNRATMFGGIAAGPMTPYQPTTSNPGSASATAGSSGSEARRLGVVTASARSLPERTCTSAPCRPEKLNS
jgi:hypothetical protein